MQLRDDQLEAIKQLSNGKILSGGTGSGKTLTSLGYYYIFNGGSGYFLAYRAIMILKGDEEFLEGYRDIGNFIEPEVAPEALKEYAETCMANNGEFVFEDEWDELDESYDEEEDDYE